VFTAGFPLAAQNSARWLHVGPGEVIRRRISARSSRNTLSCAGLETGSLRRNVHLATVKHLKPAYCRPATPPHVSMSSSEVMRAPTILPVRPTSINTKRNICATRFGARVFVAFLRVSGRNNVASAQCAQHKNHSPLWVALALLRAPRDGWLAQC
jgi:hypothetical protein